MVYATVSSEGYHRTGPGSKWSPRELAVLQRAHVDYAVSAAEIDELSLLPARKYGSIMAHIHLRGFKADQWSLEECDILVGAYMDPDGMIPSQIHEANLF
jgi:hypothetical protein